VPTATSPLFSISMRPTMSASIAASAETIFASWRANSADCAALYRQRVTRAFFSEAPADDEQHQCGGSYP